MAKLDEIKGKILAFLEKLRANPKLAHFFRPKEKAPESPNNPTVLFREGSLRTRLQLIVVFILLIGFVGGVWFTGKMIFGRMQKNKSLLAESKTYQKEFEDFNQRIRDNASITSVGSFTTNTWNLKGEGVRVSVDLWIRFSNPDTAAYAEAISVKVSDRIGAALSRMQIGKVSLFSDSGKQNLRDEIKRQVDPLLRQGKVMDVYFHNLVAQ
jgi:flagellar basal body-associated protein FliL